MKTSNTSFMLTLNNSLQELPRLGHAIRELCSAQNVPAETLYSVNLAIDELFTNVVTHGYDDSLGSDHQIVVKVAVCNGSINIQMIDDGVAFNPWRDAPVPETDAPLESRQVGGLGLHLVKSMMDNLEYQRRDGHNTIKMRKDFSSTPSAA